MNYCPYCNWEIVRGKCSQGYQCGYVGPGHSVQERNRRAEGYELGQLSPGESNNGAGAYDHDTDFS